MKCLLFVLAIGLLLPYFTGSAKPKEINLDEKFTKLCGRDYVLKVLKICKNIDRSSLPLHPYDHSQGSDDDDYFKKTNTEKVQRTYDNMGIQQLELGYGQKPFYNDYNRYQQMSDNLHQFVSETEGASMMQPALPKHFHRMELSKRQILSNDDCCKDSCTVRQLRRLCFW